MKRAFLLLLPLLASASQSDINTRVDALSKEIKLLQAQVADDAIYMAEYAELFDNVEKKSILDKINLTPELLLRMDKLNYTNKYIQGENTLIYNPDGTPTTLQRRDEFTKNFDPATTIRFRLNMSMELDNVKFYGRMLYMNSSQSNQRLCILSRDIKTGTAGSAFDVDRAYVDYKINKHTNNPLTLSFGILPTTDGTPMQYSKNQKRHSMFPALVFDMNSYGLIVTQQISNATFARAILAKAYTLRPNFYPYQCNRENIDNADITGLYLDTSFYFLGNSLLSFGVNLLNNLKAYPYLGPDIGTDNAHNLGAMATFGFGIDIEKFLHTNTTLFIHTALSNPHSNGNIDDYKIIAPLSDGLTIDGSTGFTTADYATGEMLQQNGYAFYVGGKYDFVSNVSFGAEYNYGSKYWFSATQGAEDMFNKLATRGYAVEMYSLWQFHKYINAKLSYLHIKENYTGSGWHFGEPAKKDARQEIYSLSLEAKF
ncbi:DUF3373 family protein [Sulfurimonas sp.]